MRKVVVVVGTGRDYSKHPTKRNKWNHY